LTPAQRVVLELMAEGLHDDAIAHRLGISTTTVAVTSRPSSTDLASRAGLPQVQLPRDGDGLVRQQFDVICADGKSKRLPSGIPQLQRTQSVTERLEVESRDGAAESVRMA
jgi:hypothetical protein